MNVYQLSNLAGCASPDSATSPGAIFLRDVFDAFQSYTQNPDTPPDPEDLPFTIADEEVYRLLCHTHTLFLTAVDLCAYAEDVSELQEPTTDPEDILKTALFIIAERLVHALQETTETEED